MGFGGLAKSFFGIISSQSSLECTLMSIPWSLGEKIPFLRFEGGGVVNRRALNLSDGGGGGGWGGGGAKLGRDYEAKTLCRRRNKKPSLSHSLYSLMSVFLHKTSRSHDDRTKDP